MNQSFLKRLSVLLAGVMFFTFSGTAFAQQANTPKEEVVYVNLDANGTVKNAYVVNSFELAQDGTIVDYGDYSETRNLSTTDAIEKNGDQITIAAKAGKLYYQGNLENAQIPWNIAMRYYLDGKEYPAAELAGKSGALKIEMSITENSAANTTFFEDYALQVSLQLDTEKCKNITAEDATIANVGSDKQITYTIFPGKGKDMTVTADVTGFEMDGISINGITLDMAVDVDTSELTDKVTDLQDGIAELDDGAGDLADGVNDLADGTQEMNDGAAKINEAVEALKTGAASLDSGVAGLKSGLDQLQSAIGSLNVGAATLDQGITQLKSKSTELTSASSAIKTAISQISEGLESISNTTSSLDQLTSASATFKTALSNLVDGIAQIKASFATYDSGLAAAGISISGLLQQNTDATTGIDTTIAALQSKIDAEGDATGQLAQQTAQLQSIKTLLTANSGALTANSTFIEQLRSGITGLYGDESNPGAAALLTQYTALDTAIQSLPGSLNTMVSGLADLKTAIDTLSAKYTDFDAGITEYTQAVEGISSGYSALYAGIDALLSGSDSLVSGMNTLKDGASSLLDGLAELYGAAGDMEIGSEDLLNGSEDLRDGAKDLTDGTGELRDETSDMDTEIDDRIDEMLDGLSGENKEVVSFVSDKDTNVQALQFFLKTEEIKLDDSKPAETESTTQTGFFEKLMQLFGLV